MTAASGPTEPLSWETVLDRLELDVLKVERYLEDQNRPLPEPWQPPQP